MVKIFILIITLSLFACIFSSDENSTEKEGKINFEFDKIILNEFLVDNKLDPSDMTILTGINADPKSPSFKYYINLESREIDSLTFSNSIKDLKLEWNLYINDNNLKKLPLNIQLYSWNSISLFNNNICNISETDSIWIALHTQNNWKTFQKCN